jgi:YcxB-like protein
MKIEFDLTKEDYLQFNLHHMANSKTVKKSLFIQQYISSTIFLIVPFIAVKITDVPLIVWLVCFSIIYLLWIFQYPKFFNSIVIRRLEKMLEESNSKNLYGIYTIDLTEDGVHEISKSGETKINWNSIVKVEETDSYIFIYNTAISAYIIPGTAFPDNNERAEFINILKLNNLDYKRL